MEPTRVLGVYGEPQFRVSYRNGDQVDYVMVVFEARIVSGSLSPDGTEGKQSHRLQRCDAPLPLSGQQGR